MANKIIQATALPTGEQAQLILIDNGDGTFTQTVAFDRDTYPSRAAGILAGSSIVSLAAFQQALWPPTGPFTMKRLFTANLGSGTTDVYTCPAGKRAIVSPIVAYNQTVATTVNYVPQIKIGGNYFFLSGSAGVNVAANVRDATFSANYILNAGESLAIVTNNAGLNYAMIVAEYEADALSNLKQITFTSWQAGDNAIYTCPAGKTAVFISLASGSGSTPFTAGSNAAYVNSSLAGRTLIPNLLPSGTLVSSANTKIGPSQVVANAAGAVVPTPGTYLQAGDAYVVNVDAGTATQMLRAIVAEYEA